MVDVKYRLVTDPSEGPKLFQIDTRVTSRGETAVLLTGIDCAERVVCRGRLLRPGRGRVRLQARRGQRRRRPGPAAPAGRAEDQPRVRHGRRAPRTRVRAHPGGIAATTLRREIALPDSRRRRSLRRGILRAPARRAGGQGPPTPQGPGGAPEPGAGLLAMLRAAAEAPDRRSPRRSRQLASRRRPTRPPRPRRGT